MTEKAPTTEIWTVLEPGLTLPRIPTQRRGQSGPVVASYVAARGDEFIIDDAVREFSRDRFGRAWVDDLSDEAQVEYWGKKMLLEGSRPEWLQVELDEAAEAEAAAKRLERKREAHRYGKHLAPTDDEILEAADRVRARLASGVR